MDAISRALDKAKQANEQAARNQQPEPEMPRIGRAATQVVNPSPARLESNRVLTALSDQRALDAYNLLRTQVLQVTKAKGWTSLMVTSVGPGEGKTTTAINLAASLARDAQQTSLLVDCHLRAPKVDTYLGLEACPGLTDHLLNDEAIPDLLVSPGMDHFVVLPAGRCLSASTDLLGSPRVKGLVKEFQDRYPDRYVLYDCPHLLDMPDALVFSSYVDGIILVVEADRTRQQDIESALGLLKDKNLIGLVLNKVH